jgi:hypothetical protein
VHFKEILHRQIFLKAVFIFTLSFHCTLGQKNVIGRVLDFETRKPLKQAIVTIKGTTAGTTTNALGFFQLPADTTDDLIIESQGFETGQVKVPTQNNFQVYLKKAVHSEIIQVNNGYEKGTIQDGYKIGIWEYYDKPDELSLKVDYNTGQLVYITKDTTTRYAVEINGVWTQLELDVQPRYIGSMVEYYKLFGLYVRYPVKARRNSTVGIFYITFDVDTTGRADNFNIIDDIGDDCGEESIKALKLIPNFWTAASKDNVKYKSRFILPVRFKISLEGKDVGRQNKKKNTEVGLPIACKLTEVVVTAVGLSRPRN